MSCKLIFHLFIRSQLRYCPAHKTTSSGDELQTHFFLFIRSQLRYCPTHKTTSSGGYDCGLQIGSYNDLQVGDYVEAYEDVEIKRK